MLEPRIIELLLLAGLIYMYRALRRESKRVRILSHFVSGAIYYSVDTTSNTASEDDGRSAASIAPSGRKSLDRVLWDAHLDWMLQRIYCELEVDYGAEALWRFVKRDRTLFDRWASDGGFTTLYRRLHKYVDDQLRPVMSKAGA